MNSGSLTPELHPLEFTTPLVILMFVHSVPEFRRICMIWKTHNVVSVALVSYSFCAFPSCNVCSSFTEIISDLGVLRKRKDVSYRILIFNTNVWLPSATEEHH